MPRHNLYARGTVTRSFTLSVDADETLTKLANKAKHSRSQALSTAIMAQVGKTPKLSKQELAKTAD